MWLGFIQPEPLMRELDTSSSKSSRFRPFARKDSAPTSDNVAALTDVLVAMRETIERQGQRHEELMTYLSHLPKAMELIPENSRLQSEALGSIRQFLENQGTVTKQLSTTMEKSGQAAMDQRRILDAVRQRLDMSAENDTKISEHFNNFATAISTSTETTRMAGEVLRLLEENNRKRDETLERIIHVHQRRHTVILAASVVLSGAALIAVTVFMYLVNQHMQ